jgi:nucleotide-binding universal stress UspA family protein
MFRSLLVPLDRSPFAEQALPFALSIARRANARLELVEVHASYAWNDRHACWAPFDDALDASWKQQEQLYLEATAKWLASMSRVSISAGVLPGSDVLPETVAEGIQERARASRTDLIVMATHGRGPGGRFALGSVADELLRRACVPVLLVRRGQTAPELIPEPALDDVLIPLDGSPLAEQVLAPALDLARLMEARCSLLRVVERPSSGHGSVGLPEVAQAEAYLQRVAGRMRERGLQVRARALVARRAAEAIAGEAEAQGSKLIALATHGRGGLKRLLVGSVADQVVRRAATPVLVYRPSGTGP